MSRNRFAGFVAAACAATSLIGAAPAQAGPGDPVGCIPTVSGPNSGQNVVWVNGLDVTVNPSGGVDTAGLTIYAVGTAWAVGVAYPFCVAGDLDDPAWCALGMPLGDYVYQDPNTGQITIRGNEVVADANNCI